MNTHTLMRGAAIAAVAALTGCAGEQTKPLYYWGDYQGQVYGYLKTRDDAPQAQLARLDATQQKALSQNAALPPGFSAHLGLLYLKAGQAEKAQSAFLTEEAQFPESKSYMDFLLKRKPATPIAKPPLAPVKPAVPSTTPTPVSSAKAATTPAAAKPSSAPAAPASTAAKPAPPATPTASPAPAAAPKKAGDTK